MFLGSPSVVGGWDFDSTQLSTSWTCHGVRMMSEIVFSKVILLAFAVQQVRVQDFYGFDGEESAELGSHILTGIDVLVKVAITNPQHFSFKNLFE